MRRIVVSAFSLFTLALPAAADTVNVTCRAFAHAMAEEYMGDRLERASKSGAQLGDDSRVLIIGPGKSHYVPRYQTGITRSYWAQMRLYNEIYNEEYWRCRRGGNITINVDPADLNN